MTISIVTPIRGRKNLMPALVECFQQSLPVGDYVEWLVVDNSDAPLNLPKFVRHIYIGPQPQCIGAMRNVCAQQASGEIIAHMDSDDYYAPGYFAESVLFLLESGKQVAGCHSILFTDEATGEHYRFTSQHKTYACGASLIYYRNWWGQHRFKNVQICEDTAFCNEARAHGQLASRSTHLLIARRNHEYGNTCRQEMREPEFVLLTDQSVENPTSRSVSVSC